MIATIMRTLCFALCVQSFVSSVHAGDKTDPSKYRRFASTVKKLIQQARPVLESRSEAGDVRALDFRLRDFNKSVAAGRLRDAAKTADKMRLPLARVHKIVKNASHRVHKRQQRTAHRNSRIRALEVQDAVLSAQANAAARLASTSRAARRELNRLNDEIWQVRCELKDLRQERSNERELYARLQRDSRA